MCPNQIIGSRGFVALFEGFIYNKVRKACKNIVIKIFVHSIGLMLMIVGTYYLITSFISPVGTFGLLLMFLSGVILLSQTQLSAENFILIILGLLAISIMFTFQIRDNLIVNLEQENLRSDKDG